MEQYPAVRIMVKHGNWLAIVVGLCLPAVVLVGMAVIGWHWIWLLVAILAGIALGFAFRTFAELTRIIADMLLPQ